MRNAVLIVAGGQGLRARTDVHSNPKQYVQVLGNAVIWHTIKLFLASSKTDVILVVVADGHENIYNQAVLGINDKRLMAAIIGGNSRQQSVFAGLTALSATNPDCVLIHDAARPCLAQRSLAEVYASLSTHKAVLVGTPVADTLKKLGTGSLETIDRTNIWNAQTPQAFDFNLIFDVHRKAVLENNTSFTDDCGLAEWAGQNITMIDGGTGNFKITNPDDFELAECILKGRSIMLNDTRVGTGYDVHAFEPGDLVILGGVSIPHNKKLKGHSDADVALHAITDAMLGALADGDIGTHFPPSDPQWKGVSSDRFLIDAVRRVQDKGGKIRHIDLTIVCEEPKIGAHRPAMKKSIATICNLEEDRISVKATTSERLGFTGRREGIAALATVTLGLPEEI
ncbi:MAG: bifunctional 2-C-methyl-D-erythritol 4-phosphate cytidylyltransferase/2-C-methyl-D-erythritol 2,4-cyclodiphosphate synthase [Cohaesibacteraceae bacterium]|nr:bifunctional 2-C-methyl-D-erythritol 4-phosphate cytidylyltransferase/2-C-methyl-D-erythritol 2,4-cyclodiphosphate synthase [Cohaesibacteraceae bacterium]